MKKTDVLVIGGSAAGLVSAMTAKSNNPDKKVMLVRKEEKVMIPCGIPYIFGTLGSSDKNILPDDGLIKLGVEIVIDSIDKIDVENKCCGTISGESICYGKLILATGSKPVRPKTIKGIGLDNVFTIPKDKTYLDNLKEEIEKSKDIVIIGAGFIGVEMADEINKMDKNVVLVELLPRILGLAFDKEIAQDAEKTLVERGVKVITGSGLEEIIGEKRASAVKLCNGQLIKADVVMLSMGYCPNTELALDAGIKVNEKGFIIVDEYMRTSEDDIFAVGDCASKRDFATGKISTTMLASTACAEARVAGLNLFYLSTFRTFRGTIGIYSTNIGKSSYGVAGLTEETAVKEGFNIVTGTFEGVDRHPGKLTNSHKQIVKIIVSKDSGRILGGEVIGGNSVGELINVIGFVVQGGLTLTELLVAQIGTQPMLTASPAAYPLIKAGEMVLKNLIPGSLKR